MPNSSRYLTTWIGNSFGGGEKWVQLQISTLYVTPDGTCFTNSLWDEAGREVGIYKDGDVLGQIADLHVAGRLGGEAICANDKYLFVGMEEQYGDSGQMMYGVRRYDYQQGNPVPFANSEMLSISMESPVTGLCATETYLWVSDPSTASIRGFSTESGQEVGHYACPHPHRLALNPVDQGVWVIQKDNRPRVGRITPAGLVNVIENLEDPNAIAFFSDGQLLVAENGTRQQVLIYDTSPSVPVLIGTLGEERGVFKVTKDARRGEVGEFRFAGLSGVGADQARNIYVAQNGFNNSASGCSISKFSADLNRLEWQLFGLEFMDCADVDPISDGIDVYTKHEHFVMDWSKPPGQQWTYKGFTIDPFRYPQDPRLAANPAITTVFVRRIQGKLFLFVTDMFARILYLYRQEKNSEIFIPCGMFGSYFDEVTSFPLNLTFHGEYMWRDKQGDGIFRASDYEKMGEPDIFNWGWEIDEQGDVWKASESSNQIKRYHFQGFDKFGAPVYSKDAISVEPAPSLFTKSCRLKYFSSTDTMYLSGYTHDRPKIGQEYTTVGSVIVRYDRWSTSRILRYQIPIPYDTNANLHTKAMDVAGNRIFGVTMQNPVIMVWDATTGEEVMQMTPGEEVYGQSGWVDIPYGLRAFQRSNGDYLVFVEEDWKAKVIVYQVPA
ncbi:MAG TPA: hypothetical protein DCP31_05585 [Cyanobacteria bacterium UBA8543]|nr:hypothetical protein [Cyanobacteria bacterium UBA8543]